MTAEIRCVESASFAQNSYVLWLPGRSDAVVVDPGFEPDLILDMLKGEGLSLAAILNTHGHVDHIAGNRAVKQAFPNAPIVIGVGDAAMLTDADLNLSGPFGLPITSPSADRVVKEGDSLSFAGMDFDVLDIPGHSPGHVVYLVRGTTPLQVLGGDVLFREGIGRYDFPGGSFRRLAEGIRTKLFTLPPDSVVYPGHGPVTTIGYETANNPIMGVDA
jgi:glyoxylase-like metal-dependent hydrolase (beta-lactamase superfamily II)